MERSPKRLYVVGALKVNAMSGINQPYGWLNVYRTKKEALKEAKGKYQITIIEVAEETNA